MTNHSSYHVAHDDGIKETDPPGVFIHTHLHGQCQDSMRLHQRREAAQTEEEFKGDRISREQREV